MIYEGYKTFRAEQNGGILTVTIDFPPVNLQGQEMLADLERTGHECSGNPVEPITHRAETQGAQHEGNANQFVWRGRGL